MPVSDGIRQSQQNKMGKQKAPRTRASGSTDCPVPVVHKDVYHRLNFMYQASAFLDALGTSQSTTPSRKGKERQTETPKDAADDKLARRGVRSVDANFIAKESMKTSFKTIAVHQTLRLDSSLKRSICKTCGTVLVPGMTSSVRVRPSKNHQQMVHNTCLFCTSISSLPAPPFHDEVTADGSNKPLDGPIRARRRSKAQRKVPFSDKEARDGRRGHELWNAEGKITGWGCAAADELSGAVQGVTPPMAEKPTVLVQPVTSSPTTGKAVRVAGRHKVSVADLLLDEEAMMNT